MLAHAGTLAGQTGGVHDLRGHCPRADVITNVRPVDTFDASRTDIMKKTCFALIVLVLFTLYTAFTLWHADQSLLEFGLQLMSSPDTAQVVIDLYVMAGLRLDVPGCTYPGSIDGVRVAVFFAHGAIRVRRAAAVRGGQGFFTVFT